MGDCFGVGRMLSSSPLSSKSWKLLSSEISCFAFRCFLAILTSFLRKVANVSVTPFLISQASFVCATSPKQIWKQHEYINQQWQRFADNEILHTIIKNIIQTLIIKVPTDGIIPEPDVVATAIVLFLRFGGFIFEIGKRFAFFPYFGNQWHSVFRPTNDNEISRGGKTEYYWGSRYRCCPYLHAVYRFFIWFHNSSPRHLHLWFGFG